MRNLGPREAANEIRQQAELDQSARTSPEEAHALKFAKDVAAELGFDTTKPENVFHVFQLLREHDIAPHVGQEYPKYVKRGYDGAMMIADNEQHAHDIENAEPPAAPGPAASAYEVPHAAPDIDLKDKVPHFKPKEPEPIDGAVTVDAAQEPEPKPVDVPEEVVEIDQPMGKAHDDPVPETRGLKGKKSRPE